MAQSAREASVDESILLGTSFHRAQLSKPRAAGGNIAARADLDSVYDLQE